MTADTPDVELTEDERVALTDALASDGCWIHEECCWTSFEAMIPAVERIIAARLAAALAERDDTLRKVRALADEADDRVRADVEAYEAKHPGNRSSALVSTADIRAALGPVRDTEATKTSGEHPGEKEKES